MSGSEAGEAREATRSVPPTLIIMGVSGCGKTVVGSLLAQHLGGIFEDGDDFHTEAAKEKMRSGTPLTDDDRKPWYATLRRRIEEMRGITPCYILACSALKAKYRDWLRQGDSRDDMEFVFLDGSFELIHGRMAKREGHYMPVSLLESQFAALEMPGEEVHRVSIDAAPEAIATEVLRRLGV